MNRLYHWGLVTLLTLIVVAFLLLFTDLGLSPVANRNVGVTRRLSLSAELAYYNYWLTPAGDNSNSQERELPENDDLHQHHTNQLRRLEGAQKSPEVVTGNDDNKTVQYTATSSQDVGKVHASNIGTSSDSFPELIIRPQIGSDHASNTNKSLAHVTQHNSSTTNAASNAVYSTQTTGEVEWLPRDSMENVVIEEAEEYYDSEREDEDQFEVTEMDEAKSIRNALLSGEKDDDMQFPSLEDQTVNDTNHNQTSEHRPIKISPRLMERSTDANFHMPCPKVYRPVEEILMAPWMKPLLHLLSSFQGRQVTLVIANSAYRDVLLNWLVSARIVSQPPLENIVVVCLDHILYRLLQIKNIPSIVAPFTTVLNTRYRFRRYFELIMMMRLAFMRLINRLGYDCAMYDIDAIILKNPQPLYEKWADVDIIGSRGELPRELWRRWGVTICIGAVFIRSNSRTELYWKAVYSAKLRGGGMANDQIRLNYGLHEVHVQWEHTNHENRQHDTPALGQSSSTDLSVVVVPFSVMCRFGCRADSRDKYYIWHKGGSRDKKSKMKGARQGGTWFLRDRWSELHSNMIVDDKGTKWLQHISSHIHRH